MATSNSVNHTTDRDTLIGDACAVIGVGTEGEPLDPETITTLSRRLNYMIKHWAVHGFHLWKRERQSITLVVGQYTYTLGQKAAGTTTATTASKLVDSSAGFVGSVAVGDTIYNTTDSTSTTISAIDSTTTLSVADDIFISGENYEITSANVSFPRPDRILECDRKDADGNEVTINPLSLQEYENLPNKTTSGTPVQYFYDPELDNGKLYIWPAPDAAAVTNFTIEIVAQTQVHDMDSSTDTFDFPQEWYEPIVQNLAYKASFIYPTQRLGEMQLLKMEAKDSLDDVTNFDQDDTSVFIAPDYERGR